MEREEALEIARDIYYELKSLEKLSKLRGSLTTIQMPKEFNVDGYIFSLAEIDRFNFGSMGARHKDLMNEFFQFLETKISTWEKSLLPTEGKLRGLTYSILSALDGTSIEFRNGDIHDLAELSQYVEFTQFYNLKYNLGENK